MQAEHKPRDTLDIPEDKFEDDEKTVYTGKLES